jgi:cation:H+ antiporter
LIGALVVGLGTSLPELLVSGIAAGNGELDVAMGNVVGSNIANVTLVLGAAGAYRAISSRVDVLRREGSLMLLAVVGLAVVLWNGDVTRTEGIALILGMVAAVTLLVRWARDHGSNEVIAVDEVEETAESGRSVRFEVIAGILSLVVTVLGANILLGGALDLGERLGLSPTFLGVMLGVGTSLPELATAVAAARRAASDLVVGNVLGSNLFNSLAVAGTAAVIGPATLIDLSRVDLVWMVGAVVVAGVFARTGILDRRESLILLISFFVFAVVSF